MEYNASNFYKNTIAKWKPVPSLFETVPDHVSYTAHIIIFNDCIGETGEYRYTSDRKYLDKYDTVSNPSDKIEFIKTGTSFFIIEELSVGVKIRIPRPIISSKYWYSEEGVYRYSNHWQTVNTCYWDIGNAYYEGMGFCKWADFSMYKTSIQPAKKTHSV